jgi:hypothetical protein
MLDKFFKACVVLGFLLAAVTAGGVDSNTIGITQIFIQGCISTLLLFVGFSGAR